jgi:lipopolysaccharide export system protein LptC
MGAGSMTSAEPVTVTMPTGSIRSDTIAVAENGKTISFVSRRWRRAPAR